MTFEGAIVREQGVTFEIVVVKESAIRNSSTAQDLIAQYQQIMGVVPVVSMARDIIGTPKYYGHKNVINFLASIDFRRIPWKKYTYS